MWEPLQNDSLLQNLFLYSFYLEDILVGWWICANKISPETESNDPEKEGWQGERRKVVPWKADLMHFMFYPSGSHYFSLLPPSWHDAMLNPVCIVVLPLHPAETDHIAFVSTGGDRVQWRQKMEYHLWCVWEAGKLNLVLLVQRRTTKKGGIWRHLYCQINYIHWLTMDSIGFYRLQCKQKSGEFIVSFIVFRQPLKQFLLSIRNRKENALLGASHLIRLKIYLNMRKRKYHCFELLNPETL